MGCHTWSYIPSEKSIEELKELCLFELSKSIKLFNDPKITPYKDKDIIKAEKGIKQAIAKIKTGNMKLLCYWLKVCNRIFYEDGIFYKDCDIIDDNVFRSNKYDTNLKTEKEVLEFLNDDSVWLKADDAEQKIKDFFKEYPQGFIRLG